MQSSSRKIIFGVILIGITILTCVKFFNEKGIRYGYSKNWMSFLNVHVSDVSWLSINGKTFYHLKGAQPFYLPVPNTPYVYFVTELHNESKIIHFFSLENGKEIKFEESDCFLGYRMHMGEPELEWIESSNNSIIVIGTKDQFREDRYTFNLLTKESEKEIIKK